MLLITLLERKGLAVSGGVDSMCLAALAAELQTRHSNEFNFRALIVDHKARPGSSEEAQTVKGWLEKRGLPTSILELKWPSSVEPLRLPNFETEARTLRFRELGLECHRLGIKELLMGHHRDDQAETIMGRIVQGYTGSGLAGVASETTIPECFGYYGVHNTPGPVLKQQRIRAAGKPIMVQRPLLEYPKDQLREVCRQLKMTWKEDQTNADATLTMRNAVRYLLTRNLPAALKRESLVVMGKFVARRNLQLREAVEKDVFPHIKFQYFDMRSGVLRVHIPVQMFMKQLNENELDTRRQLGLAMALTADCVSPTGAMSMGQGLEIAERIFQPPEKRQSFTVGDVYFYKEEFGTRWESTWTLCRRPIPSNPRLIATDTKTSLVWNRAQTSGTVHQDVEDCQTTFGNWQLFDGRFWIRVWTSLDYESLEIRPLKSTDLKSVVLNEKRREKLELRLKSAAPGDKIPWTLPALVTNPGDQLLALPSLGIYANDNPLIMRGLFWEVYYKWTDLYSKHRGKINHHQPLILNKFLRPAVKSNSLDMSEWT